MFQTSKSCIKLHAVVMLEHFLSEQCPLLQVSVCVCVCVCVCVHCSKCVCTWMDQMQSTHFTAGYTLYICVCDKKNKIKTIQNRYPIMVKCLNIGKNIGKPIYRSISNLQYFLCTWIWPLWLYLALIKCALFHKPSYSCLINLWCCYAGCVVLLMKACMQMRGWGRL